MKYFKQDVLFHDKTSINQSFNQYKSNYVVATVFLLPISIIQYSILKIDDNYV